MPVSAAVAEESVVVVAVVVASWMWQSDPDSTRSLVGFGIPSWRGAMASL